MNDHLTTYPNGIHALDSGYLRPRLAAIHLIEDSGRIAFVDTATNATLPRSLATLESLGYAPEDVEFVILTHIHLDHAGSAGTMMQRFPNAKLVVHPRGAPHMIDPTKLIAGVEAVYGRENARQMYGDLLPVAAERIVEAPDNTRIRFGSRELLCLDTPGHARHHIAIFDSVSGSFFTGDTFGIAYPDTPGGDRPFILPTTTPTQFDPDALKESIRRLLPFEPEAMYMTHFARVAPPESLAEDLLRHIDAYVAMTHQAKAASAPLAHLQQALADYTVSAAREAGCAASDKAILATWAGDIRLNAQGLAHWAGFH